LGLKFETFEEIYNLNLKSSQYQKKDLWATIKKNQR